MSRKVAFLFLFLFFLVSLGIYSNREVFQKEGDTSFGSTLPSSLVSSEKSCDRIISLAPSITEVLFALGLGEKVVGVTSYCKYPHKVQSITRVGGYYDPNYETMVALKPDLVILLKEHEGPRSYLPRLGIDTLTVSHTTISSIMASISLVGKVCGVEKEAKRLTTYLKEKIEHIREKTKGLYQPRVLISISRDIGNGSLRNVYIAGKGTFFDEMITIAGGKNVYSGRNSYPLVSAEGIVTMDPEVIIDIVPDMEEKGLTKEDVLKAWKKLSSVKAVREGRVYVISDDYAVVPGPRFVLILEKIARFVHPEVKW